MTPEISIIVPIYNAEAYLKETLEALLSQTLEAYEIILVDNGSTDRSGEICSEYLRKHENIRCCSIEKRGPGCARNYGLSVARGRYIGFCDADDLPDREMYRTLRDSLRDFSADLALCDIYSERDQRRFGFPWEGKRCFSGEGIEREFLPELIGNESDNDQKVPVWGSVVRCLYRREIIARHGICFPEELSFAEDLIFTLRYVVHCRKIYICDAALYWYRCTPDSLMNSHSRYKENMFNERLKLVHCVEEVLSGFRNDALLRKRLATTERCYYAECVGNACCMRGKRAGVRSYLKVREIVRAPEVVRAFARFDARGGRKRILYFLVAKRQSLLLWLYFQIRLRQAGREVEVQ